MFQEAAGGARLCQPCERAGQACGGNAAPATQDMTMPERKRPIAEGSSAPPIMEISRQAGQSARSLFDCRSPDGRSEISQLPRSAGRAQQEWKCAPAMSAWMPSRTARNSRKRRPLPMIDSMTPCRLISAVICCIISTMASEDLFEAPAMQDERLRLSGEAASGKPGNVPRISRDCQRAAVPDPSQFRAARVAHFPAACGPPMASAEPALVPTVSFSASRSSPGAMKASGLIA